MENPIKMDDLGVSLFLETPMLKIFGVFFVVEISSCSFFQAAVRGNGHVKLQMSGGSAEAFGWGWLERSRGEG